MIGLDRKNNLESYKQSTGMRIWRNIEKSFIKQLSWNV